MILKRLSLFVIACFMSTALGILGNILGATFSWIGAWVGYLVGGTLGIVVAVRIAARGKLIYEASFISTLVVGWVGFVCGVAALFYIHSLPWPIIPLISLSTGGVGAVIGNLARMRERKS